MSEEIQKKLPSWYFLLKEWWEKENKESDIHAP
jgi:hypothetical protein